MEASGLGKLGLLHWLEFYQERPKALTFRSDRGDKVDYSLLPYAIVKAVDQQQRNEPLVALC